VLADLAEWSAESWSLGLGVFAASDAPLGMVTVRARDFAVVREEATSSWLGLPTLAFDHLGASPGPAGRASPTRAQWSTASRRAGPCSPEPPDGAERAERSDPSIGG